MALVLVQSNYSKSLSRSCDDGQSGMNNNHWARLLAYVTGLVNQELLLQNEYLAAENRILRAHLPTRLRLTGNPGIQTRSTISLTHARRRRLMADPDAGNSLKWLPGKWVTARQASVHFVRNHLLGNYGPHGFRERHGNSIAHPAGTYTLATLLGVLLGLPGLLTLPAMAPSWENRRLGCSRQFCHL